MELYIRSERDQMKKIISKILIAILLISSCIGTINVAPVTVNAATRLTGLKVLQSMVRQAF